MKNVLHFNTTGDHLEHYFTNNDNLKSELRVINYNFKEYNFMLNSDLGVFSKDKIDFGSRLLLESFLHEKKNIDNCRILDLGCGYGFIGIVLAKLKAKVTMSDVNKRAVHLSEMNLKQNNVDAKVILSDAYENIDEKYDYILTNPPIRAGKEKILEILIHAKNYLNKDGELWFVMRKDQGAKSVIKTLENDYKCQIPAKSKGFFIIFAQIH